MAQIKADGDIWTSGKSQVVAVQGPMPGRKAEAAAEAAMAASLALERAAPASHLASEPQAPAAVLQPQCTDRKEVELEQDTLFDDAMGCAGASESPIGGEDDMDDIFLTLDASLTDEAMGGVSEPVEGMIAPAKCTLASLKYIKPLTLMRGQA